MISRRLNTFAYISDALEEISSHQLDEVFLLKAPNAVDDQLRVVFLIVVEFFLDDIDGIDGQLDENASRLVRDFLTFPSPNRAVLSASSNVRSVDFFSFCAS